MDGPRGLDVLKRPKVETSGESDARYRGLLEAAPDAMVVVDQAGAIVLLNLQAEKQFGYQRDELVGQPVTNIIPEGFAERLIADEPDYASTIRSPAWTSTWRERTPSSAGPRMTSPEVTSNWLPWQRQVTTVP